MTKLFEKMITEAVRQAMADLTDHAAHAWSQAMTTYGSDSIEAAHKGLILASIHYVNGEHKRVDSLVRDYVYAAEETYGPLSSEVLSGLFLLSNNYVGWGRLEDSRCVLDRVKFVAERCRLSRDSVLEGLCDFAERCDSAEDPTNKRRGFMLFLLALSWCCRYSPEGQVYNEFAPRLQRAFEAYGFVEEKWQWLVQRSKYNLNDLVGLMSILLENQVLPSASMLPFTASSKEEALESLIQAFPVNSEIGLQERIRESEGQTTEPVFLCPRCGSRDLRTKFPEALYQISTLDKIVLNPTDVDPFEILEREPSEYEGVGHSDEWEFWCDKCHLTPSLRDTREDEPVEETLARWLLDNCPQSPEGRTRPDESQE
jgi:hypothetical protein